MKKFTAKQKRQLKLVWEKVKRNQDLYWENIRLLEELATASTGIKDIEIFHVDGEPVGFGTSGRDYELWDLT